MKFIRGEPDQRNVATYATIFSCQIFCTIVCAVVPLLQVSSITILLFLITCTLFYNNYFYSFYMIFTIIIQFILFAFETFLLFQLFGRNFELVSSPYSAAKDFTLQNFEMVQDSLFLLRLYN